MSKLAKVLTLLAITLFTMGNTSCEERVDACRKHPCS
jgi:hypothetical protein